MKQLLRARFNREVSLGSAVLGIATALLSSFRLGHQRTISFGFPVTLALWFLYIHSKVYFGILLLALLLNNLMIWTNDSWSSNLNSFLMQVGIIVSPAVSLKTIFVGIRKLL